MKRRVLVASALFSIGSLGYLLLSRGPARVQILTVVVQMALLTSLTYLAWVAPLGRRRKLIALLGTVVFMSALAVYLDSLVIMALRPLHFVYFVAGLFSFLVEALCFLGATWLVDRIVNSLSHRLQENHEDR